MDIFLLRHGQAEPQKTTDELRELTVKGRSDTSKIVSANLDRLRNVEEIWSSPLVRAQQTAELVLPHFPKLALKTSDLIIPEGDPAVVMDWLQKLQNKSKAVLLVSHQPLLGRLLNQLCGKPSDFYGMETSSLAAVRAPVVARGMGELLWLAHA